MKVSKSKVRKDEMWQSFFYLRTYYLLGPGWPMSRETFGYLAIIRGFLNTFSKKCFPLSTQKNRHNEEATDLRPEKRGRCSYHRVTPWKSKSNLEEEFNYHLCLYLLQTSPVCFLINTVCREEELPTYILTSSQSVNSHSRLHGERTVCVKCVKRQKQRSEHYKCTWWRPGDLYLCSWFELFCFCTRV